MSDPKKSTISPYLASLSDVHVRKKVRSATAFHAASVASKLFGGTNCTMDEVLSYVEDADVGNKQSREKVQKESSPGANTNKQLKTSNVLGKPPKSRHISRPSQPTPEGDTHSTSVQSHKPKGIDNLNLSLKKAEKSFSHGELRKTQSFTRNSRPPRPTSISNNPTTTAESVSASNAQQEDIDETGTIPAKKLKSILKFPSTGSLQKLHRPQSASNFKLQTTNSSLKLAGWSSRSSGEALNSRGINVNIMMAQAVPRDKGVPNKKVTFFEKVEIHPVPYESRGSTEWQQNLIMRDNMMKSIFSGPPLGYMNDNMFYSHNNSTTSSWGGGIGIMDNWGFGIAPTRIRRSRQPKL